MIANPKNRPPNIIRPVDEAKPKPFALCAIAVNSVIEKVFPPLKNNAKKPNNIKADPNKVNKKNFNEAYLRFGPPHTPIIKNIGSNTISKKINKKELLIDPKEDVYQPLFEKIKKIKF